MGVRNAARARAYMRHERAYPQRVRHVCACHSRCRGILHTPGGGVVSPSVFVCVWRGVAYVLAFDARCEDC